MVFVDLVIVWWPIRLVDPLLSIKPYSALSPKCLSSNVGGVVAFDSGWQAVLA